MEKLSETLNKLAAKTVSNSASNAFSDAAELAEAYEAEVEKRIAELTLERNALRDSIAQPVTCDMRKPYEEVHADYLMMVERARQEALRAERTERRVTELENCKQDGVCAVAPGCNRHWEERNRELVEQVRSLESQLEWTPVREGYSLPSDVGATYEFLSHALNIHVFAFDGDGRWVLAGLDDVYFEAEIRQRYSNYRRIELPEAT